MNIDYLHPDYNKVYVERVNRLNYIRKHPSHLQALFKYYKTHPADFIQDWAFTSDPMRSNIYGTSKIPFILFPRQREWIDWVMERRLLGKRGIVEKSRESGVSWLSVALACTLCIFNDGVTIGFGSRKESYVDKIGDMGSLLEKARFFMETLPPEFRQGWNRKTHSKMLTISFPNPNSYIKGDSGDQIGRGDRASLYFVDEAAFIERSHLIEASLSQTTNCRIDISTPNGMGNSFAERRFSGTIDVFTFHWTSDPRKDQAWYDNLVENLDPVTLAQEVNIDYKASADGILIPAVWVQASIDAHKKLGIDISGIELMSFDVADEGKDKCSLATRKGILLNHIEEWSGKDSDIYASVMHVYNSANNLGLKTVIYDGDGIGASVKGDSRIIGEARAKHLRVDFVQFRGSSAVVRPDKRVQGTSRTNEDFFANLKAQQWWNLRQLFRNTYRAVVEGKDYNKDEIISLSSDIKVLNNLTSQLSQPTYTINTAGKIVIDKNPAGIKSPDLADAVMMVFSAHNSQRSYTTQDVDAIKKLFTSGV